MKKPQTTCTGGSWAGTWHLPMVKILKSRPANQFTIWNDYTADFWEFLWRNPEKCVLGAIGQVLGLYRWWKFSKVGLLINLLYEMTIQLTFENFFQWYLDWAGWSKDPPPPGEVSYLLCSLIKNPEEEDLPRRICTRCFEGGPLPAGSGSGNVVNRKPPQGGGFLSIKILVLYHKTCALLQKMVKILKSRPANQFTIWNDYTADFWE